MPHTVSSPTYATILDFELGSGVKDLLRTTLNDNDRSSTEDLFEVKTEKDEAESTWQSLKAAGGKCIRIGLPGKLILSKRKGLREVIFS